MEQRTLFQDQHELQIELSHVTAGYQGKVQIHDVSLQVKRNDFVGICGPNGGGKTTLLRVMIGLLKPMHGHIRYFKDGQEVDQLKMGYLPQYSEIDRDFPITVREVVASGLLKSSLFQLRESASETEAINSMLSYLHLEDKAQQSIRCLSGGELQRTLMARALVNQPDILLLDEPTTYIDSKTELQMNKMLEELDGQRTIIMVSHDRHYIEEHARMVVHMEQTAKLSSHSHGCCYCPEHG